MPEPPPLRRSPLLMSANDAALVVVDMQEKLAPLVIDSRRVVWNATRLLRGAKILGVPALAAEQYPQGLGTTLPELAEHLPPRPHKLSFSCCGSEEFLNALQATAASKVLLCGIETHVCVLQTAYDLISEGFDVYLAADASGCRFQVDYDFALRRLDSAGCTLTTTEAALFEWTLAAGTPEFKAISALAREKPPE